MKRILTLLSFLFSFACGTKTLTPAQFTSELVDAITLTSPSTKVIVKSDLELELTASGGTSFTAFLDNAYNEYLQDPKEVKDVIQRYTHSFLEPRDEAAKVDRARIVPIIKSRQWLIEIAQSMKDRGASEPVENVSESFNDELIVVYAEDSPKNIRYLTPQDLDEIGLTRAELRELAVNNLRTILPKIEIHKGPLISMVTAGGDYEACLLLLDDLWTSGTFKVDGDIVVAVPSRDLLLLTGSGTSGGIAKLRGVATEAVESASYGLTDALFVYRDGRFLKLEAR
jgi:uncharacterized protein YtpQ (UPF0354 family)